MHRNGVNALNAFTLMLPFFAVRLVLLPLLNRGAAERAAHTAPVFDGWEKFAGNIYQLTSIAIFIYPVFMRAEPDFSWQFWTGAACYVLGIALCVASVVAYAKPDESGLVTGGVYRFSRNPMYIAYFFVFLGVTALTKSPILLSLVIVNQISVHWIILSEERWCLDTYGEAYESYMGRVRRYI